MDFYSFTEFRLMLMCDFYENLVQFGDILNKFSSPKSQFCLANNNKIQFDLLIIDQSWSRKKHRRLVCLYADLGFATLELIVIIYIEKDL